MKNVKGPMGRAAYEFTREEFRRLTGLENPPDRVAVSWMRNIVAVSSGVFSPVTMFTLHDFKNALGITDSRGEVIEVDVTPTEVTVVMSDKELS